MRKKKDKKDPEEKAADTAAAAKESAPEAKAEKAEKAKEAPPKPLPPPTPEQLVVLREQAAKAEEYLDLARRTKADFSNFQDRIRREKATWRRQSLEGFVSELLPAMDGFSMATFEDPKLLEAIRLMEKEFLRLLSKQGVVPIETEGKKFDPAFHEAVGMEERSDKEDGEIVAEARRGWLLDGHVIRAASVRIAKAPPAPKSDPKSE